MAPGREQEASLVSLRKKAVKLAARRVHPALPAAIWLGGKAYKFLNRRFKDPSDQRSERIYKKKKREKNAGN